MAVHGSLAPGLSYETYDTSPGGIAAIRTDVAGFVGIAERGPMGTPVRVESWVQFQSTFGGLIAAGHLAYVVRAFFANGGRRCHVVRVAAATATPAKVQLVTTGIAPVRPRLAFTATSPGTWGDRIEVGLHATSPASTISRPGAQPPDRLASDVEGLAGFAPGALVRVFQAGRLALRVVTEVDPVARRLTWDIALDAAFDLRLPLSFETCELSVTIAVDGRIQELFPRLSLVTTHARYLRDMLVTSSKLVTVEDFDALTPGVRSASASSDLPPSDHLRLASGADGLAALSPLDFTGDASSDDRWGLRALEVIDEVSIVAVPDIMVRPVMVPVHAPPPPSEVDPCLPACPEPATALTPAVLPGEQPPDFTVGDILEVQRGLVAHCEQLADRVALLDPPPGGGLSGAASPAELVMWRQGFDSSYAALYYPSLVVDDPLDLNRTGVRTVPPCGHVAGLCARTDLDPDKGVHVAPANRPLDDVWDVTVPIAAELQAELNPLGINCIRVLPGRGVRVYGARTVSSDPLWRFLNVRRLLSMVEKAVRIALQWTVFESNDAYLRQLVRLGVSGLLRGLWARGALAGASAEQAFYVTCDASNNLPGAVDAGQLLAEVGVAPTLPAEFVVFRVGRTQDALEVIR